MTRLRRLLIVLLIVSLATPAMAWNKPGHMVVAAIAYRDLQRNHPEVIPKVIALLKRMPDYENRWAPKLQDVPEDERDMVLFMLAGRWADDVRGVKEYDRPKHHYINLPFAPDRNVPGKEPERDNIVSSFEKNRRILKDGAVPDKAAALAWMFHQVGDIHQPLHAVALFNADHPKGDKGGTQFFIRAKEGRATISLHELWDDFLLGSQRFQSVRNEAIELSSRKELQREKIGGLKVKEFSKWAEESRSLAREIVYREGKLAGSTDRKDGVVLPEGYLKECQPLAERQAVLAGYRLADVLAEAVRYILPTR